MSSVRAMLILLLSFCIETSSVSLMKSSKGNDKPGTKSTKTYLQTGKKAHWYDPRQFHLSEDVSEAELVRLVGLFRYGKHVLNQVSHELLLAARIRDSCTRNDRHLEPICGNYHFTLLYLVSLNGGEFRTVPEPGFLGLLLRLAGVVYADQEFVEDRCKDIQPQNSIQESRMEEQAKQRLLRCLEAIANNLTTMRDTRKKFHRLLPKKGEKSEIIDVNHEKGALRQGLSKIANAFASAEERKTKLARVMITHAFTMIEDWFYYGSSDELVASRELKMEEEENEAVRLIVELIKNSKNGTTTIHDILFHVENAKEQGIRNTFHDTGITELKTLSTSTIQDSKTLVGMLSKVTRKGEEGNKLIAAMTTCAQLQEKLTGWKSQAGQQTQQVTQPTTDLTAVEKELTQLKDSLNQRYSPNTNPLEEAVKELKSTCPSNNCQQNTDFDPSITALTNAINKLADQFNSLPIEREAKTQ